MQEALHLLHLTDLHLRAGGSSLQLVQQLIEQAQKDEYWPPSWLLLGGDLVDEQDAAAFSAAYHRLGAYLKALALPCGAVPGNHDEVGLFHAVLAQYGIQTQGTTDQNGWRILLLDSSVPGQEGGRLAAEQLALLEKSADATEPAHRLIVVHHQPVAVGSAWLDRMKIDQGSSIFKLLRSNPGTQLLLFGHVHQEFKAQHQGTHLLATPAAYGRQFLPASAQFALDLEAQPGYRWLTLYADGHFTTEVRRRSEIQSKQEAS